MIRCLFINVKLKIIRRLLSVEYFPLAARITALSIKVLGVGFVRFTRSSRLDVGRIPSVIIYCHYVEFKFLLVSKEFYRHSTRSDNIGNQMPAAAFTEMRNKIPVKIIFHTHTFNIQQSLIMFFSKHCLGQPVFS